MSQHTEAHTVTTWKKAATKTNLGQKYCINPHLYPLIDNALSAHQPNTAILADIGAGTCSLAWDLLQPDTIPPITHTNSIRTIHCLEDSQVLLDMQQPHPQIQPQQFTCSPTSKLPFASKSIDIAVSRMVLMHFDLPTLRQHLAEVHRTLTEKGTYLLTVTNPSYEEWKVGRPLQEHEPYLFPSRSNEGHFTHYFRSKGLTDALLQEFFTIEACTAGIPVDNSVRTTKPYYYDSNRPMAHIYTLTPRSHD